MTMGLTQFFSKQLPNKTKFFKNLYLNFKIQPLIFLVLKRLLTQTESVFTYFQVFLQDFLLKVPEKQGRKQPQHRSWKG